MVEAFNKLCSSYSTVAMAVVMNKSKRNQHVPADGPNTKLLAKSIVDTPLNEIM